MKKKTGKKSLKVLFIVYADLEYLLKKNLSCKYNPENSYTEKKVKHKPSGYAWCSICSFDDTKNRCYFYRGNDLRNKEIKSYEKQKVCRICKEKFYSGKNKEKSEIIVVSRENLEELLIVNAI